MRVGITVDVDYPHVGEVRPTKLARSLQRAGHQVVFMSWNSRQRPVAEDLGYGRVYRFGDFLNWKMFPLLSAPSPLNPLWASWIGRIARRERLDVIVASNIRIALPTIIAAKLLRKPVVLDLQENNREVVKAYPKIWPHHYITKNSKLVGLLEDLCVRMADHTWIVIDERLEAIPLSLRRPGKISVVCHTPSLEELRASEKRRPRPKDDNFTLVYFGLFAPGVRSVEPILMALPYILERDKRVRFLVGGGGEHLVSLVKKLGIQDHVVFSGLIQPENLPAWLQQGDLGIIAYPVNSFTNTTISNKLFHYMAAGIPVLSTDMVPTRRILEEVGCGRIIPEESSYPEIAEVILRLKNSPEKLAAMGQRGRQAVLEKYNWTFDFDRALTCLERLVSSEANERHAGETVAVDSRSLDS
ncbi:MAG: glycosyltransferase family 4 protein [Candidatus Acidiferrales bacterium]